MCVCTFVSERGRCGRMHLQTCACVDVCTSKEGALNGANNPAETTKGQKDCVQDCLQDNDELKHAT